MKALIATLTALISISVFADSTATLTEKNGVQTLTISGSNRPGDGATGVLLDLPYLFLNATTVLEVKRVPDASFYEGKFISGSVSSPIGRSTRHLTIEQKASTVIRPGQWVQSIEASENDTYEIRGAAAEEMFLALVDAGETPQKAGPSSVLSGNSYSCVSTSLGGMHYTCTIAINGEL